ncbi:MAG: DEAD/DEAH box helicase [Planctomycetaceae bacterium]|nr:DEAD/DEAH box helicase [Planctomycetaceae bacterium]
MQTTVHTEEDTIPRLVLRVEKEWGIETADLVTPPRRLLPLSLQALQVCEPGVDVRRLTGRSSPSDIFSRLALDDNITAISRRTLLQLWAYFLVCEDPQRRLEAREVSTLAHQVSLVRHILENDNLRRVLIADEVGLGKTVEAGLLLKELLVEQPQSRVLYLAPARLVPNVRREFERLGLGFRQWSAVDSDARLSDNRVIASIHRAVHSSKRNQFIETDPWDVIVVDECHHLSDWAVGGGDPTQKFKLVRDLLERQKPFSRLILMSGTPHQGHVSRFENLLGLLKSSSETQSSLEGRVIFRTKDDIVDWEGNLLFPRREVNPPIVVDLGDSYRHWIASIHDYFSPRYSPGETESKQRAAGWRCAQALQWAASSPQAGLGYLVRQAVRSGMSPEDEVLKKCLLALRPYRNGPPNEEVSSLFNRIVKEIRRQDDDADIEDIEESTGELRGSDQGLCELLSQGLKVLNENLDAKWERVFKEIVEQCHGEKIVFFAQPIETVTSFANFLFRKTGTKPALIIGGQSDLEREQEVKRFCKMDGPQFLVSSRAGGEGINLQIARRLVHIDVPWNPMDMEQRVGRVHRFGSRRNIIVDTLVVTDSREEHAYRVARERLRLIVSTLVDKDRFESLFSRVMCLMPPEELQGVLINGPVGPLTVQDQESVAKMVREGFEKWRDFDQKYAQQQKLIKSQDSGLASWNDLEHWLVAAGKAQTVDGFVSEKFTLENGTTLAKSTSAPAVRLGDGDIFACCDLGGLPAYGPDGMVASQLGLNLPIVQTLLSELAFPEKETGIAAIRWPEGFQNPLKDHGVCAGVLVFVRVSVRFDKINSWMEHASRLSFFAVSKNGKWEELSPDASRLFMNGVAKASIRARRPDNSQLIHSIQLCQDEILNELKRPCEDDVAMKIRHAVTPLLACSVES